MDLNGTFAVQKPLGITSNEVVSRVRQVLTGRPNLWKNLPMKIGHGGTLDIDAEGVLVMAVGTHTKRLSLFLTSEKSYVASGKLGVATSTYEENGEVIAASSSEHVDKGTIEAASRKWVGRDLMQQPPLYSAMKLAGKRYSDYAREAQQEGRPAPSPPPARPISIFEITLINFNPPHFSIYVTCSAGTYIRSLVHDIGLACGTHAHVTQLVRVCLKGHTIDKSQFHNMGIAHRYNPLDRVAWRLEDINFASLTNHLTEHTAYDENDGR